MTAACSGADSATAAHSQPLLKKSAKALRSSQRALNTVKGENMTRVVKAIECMAAHGYFETHTLVKRDLVRVIGGENAGTLFRSTLPAWYQGLFSPSVQAGIPKASDLAGYSNDQVFIRGALHVPLSKEAVRECMPVLFDLLEEETEPRCAQSWGISYSSASTRTWTGMAGWRDSS